MFNNALRRREKSIRTKRESKKRKKNSRDELKKERLYARKTNFQEEGKLVQQLI